MIGEIIDSNTKFLIIGLGLMGGSYARALKKKGFYVEAVEKIPSLWNMLSSGDREGIREMMRVSSERRMKFNKK